MCQILYLLSERDTVLIRKVTSHNKEQKKNRRGGFFFIGLYVFKGFGEDGFVSLGKPGYTKISASTNICSLIPAVKGTCSDPAIYTFVPHCALEGCRVLSYTD